MNRFKLGKAPARPDAVSLKFGAYFNAPALPVPPPEFGHYAVGEDWGMLANDKYGCCLVEGTNVSASNITGAYRASYNGPVVEIKTASGKRLTVTPNHAVLTKRGFIRAKFLKHDDYLVGTCGSKPLPLFSNPSGCNVNIDNVPTSVDDIFSSLSLSVGFTRKIMPIAVDLHGDEKFINSTVDVVRADSFLRSELDASLRHPHAKQKISPTRQLKSPFHRTCAFMQGFFRSLAPSLGDIGIGGYRPSLAYSHVGIPQTKRLSLSAQSFSSRNNSFFQMPSWYGKGLMGIRKSSPINVHFDCGTDIPISSISMDLSVTGAAPSRIVASTSHPSIYGHSTDPQLPSNFFNAFPGLVETDCIVDINVQRYLGTHVYDLSTDSRWYIANGIIVHNCVWAGAAHESMVFNHEAANRVLFDVSSVLSDYAACTGFSPSDPTSDQGTDMQVAASYRQKTGVLDALGRRHLIDSYVALLPGDVGQLALAAYLTGAAGVGLRLPSDAEDQFNAGKPWTVTLGVGTDGGHYVPCVGRNSAGNFIVVTWGRLHAMTPEYYTANCDEAIAYISLETLRNSLTPEGFSADQLRSDVAALTA